MKRIDLIPNEEFVKNMSDELLNELINLKEALPLEIMAMIRDYRYPEINTARLISVGDDENLIKADRKERFVTYDMNKPLEANNYSSRLAIAFVKKYPQFRPMIKEVRTVEV